jgi:hypothetical protein
VTYNAKCSHHSGVHRDKSHGSAIHTTFFSYYTFLYLPTDVQTFFYRNDGMITDTDDNCFGEEAATRLAETDRSPVLPTRALVLHPARHTCNDMTMLMCLFSFLIC